MLDCLVLGYWLNPNNIAQLYTRIEKGLLPAKSPNRLGN